MDDIDVEKNGHEKGLHDTNDLNHFKRGKGASSTRFVQPRMSLLGKPLNYRQHKRDARYRRTQARIYNFLERPKDWRAISYHLLVFLMVFLCLLLSIFSTVEQYESVSGTLLYYLEIFMVIWFTLEFLIRIWSAGCRSRYQQLTGRLQFMRRPLCIVDVVVICASVVILCLGSSGQVFATSALRGLRFFQILRMVRVDRRGGSWKLLGSVVWAHRQELFTTLYIGFLGLIFSSFLVYLAEKEKNPKRFGTYADALWWGVITLCTVGYGDTVPITWAGKLIAAFCAILGISFFALPAGILGSGFALKVQQQQRQKHLIRRRVPAATLIQCLWRCYAADENSLSVATWAIHLKPCRSPPAERDKFKHNSSFMSRLSTRRKDRSSHNNSSSTKPRKVKSSFVQLRITDNDLDEPERVTQLTEVHKRAIRSLRKIKYFVARKKFKEAFRPYDVKDVIEQYSAGHIDMLARIKNLQCRLDVILGKSGSKKPDVYESKISLASRIVKVERQVDDIESKLDLLMEMYKEDRRVQNHTNQQLVALCQDHSQRLSESSSTSELHPPASPPTGPPSPSYQPIFNSKGQPLKLRSILVEKQPSEPITPIVRNPARPMHRHFSDLGPRIKKRVTYRCASVSTDVIADPDAPPSILKKPLHHLDPPSDQDIQMPLVEVPGTEDEQQEEGDEEEEDVDVSFSLETASELSDGNNTPTTATYHRLSNNIESDECTSDGDDSCAFDEGSAVELLPLKGATVAADSPSEVQRYQQRPESKTLLMRPEVLKLRKTSC
ncbi:hypothetical protein CAPTEDRAFT_183094 [Capitella teleta]|uniref:Potassium voltage-gated channel subfamily KQT member 1 n=1 Tax=Capitella teleta TaxID=283909 RepID=R7V708_CAPTE|nr:hypothetical protein CAPTEDRAFT_183094 [Capitella teleta]|eukprot:ELU11555.1 hypothetical protein CAPTEDRAFT_183094 [Capitella teleta]